MKIVSSVGILAGVFALNAKEGLGNADLAPPQEIVADGSSSFEHAEGKFSFTAPAGWTLRPSYQGMSLLIEEPKAEEVKYGVENYRRNITVVVQHQASPMDEATVKQMLTQLEEKFGKDPRITQFQNVENKMIDLRGKNDAAVIYSSYFAGEIGMMQLHLLTSSNEKTYVVTYTDLASNFSNEKSYQEAWAAVTSLKFEGVAPGRYDYLLPYGIGAGVLVLILALVKVLSARRISRRRSEVDSDLYGDSVSGASSFSSKKSASQGSHYDACTEVNFEFSPGSPQSKLSGLTMFTKI